MIKYLLYLTSLWQVGCLTTFCGIQDAINECVYTVRCQHYAGSAQRSTCNQNPYVTFVIENSRVDTLTGGFFGSTNFDSLVRVIEGRDNVWTTIEEATFRYYPKTIIINLSNNHIANINNYAFKSVLGLQHLNLSHNSIVRLETASLNILEAGSAGLKTLDVSFNELYEISAGVFKNSEDLEELYLNNNHIVSLDDDIFGDLKKLTRLNLGYNKINSINMTLLNLKSLKYLDLSHNNIISIKGYELNRLISLEYINMSYNAIKSVEPNWCNQALNLTSVDFSNNVIDSELNTMLFVNNVKLKYLNLKNNNITKMENDVFKHNSLSYLFLEGNNIDGLISQTTFSGLENITYLDLYNQSIKSLEANAFSGMNNLLSLNLSRNQISFVDNTSFSSGSELTVLDLSYNNITDINFIRNSMVNLTELFLNNNNLTNIQSGLLTKHGLLKTLDLSMNNIINIEPLSLPLNSLQYLKVFGNQIKGSVVKDVFSPAKLLRYLDLSHQNITKIEKHAFIDMPLLTRLNISYNKIVSIDAENLLNMDHLFSLDLSFNKITNFELNNTVSGNIQAVYLNNNQLKDIPNCNLSQILYLDLSNNLIANASNPIFETYRSLRVLNLSHNKLTSFNNPYTNTLTELSDLSLSSNYISSLNITYLKNLVFLNISNNGLTSINSSFLQNLNYLQSLDVSQNNISTLTPGTFQYLKILKLLNLSSNGLTNLRYGTFRGLHRTQFLDLSNNTISEVDVHVFHECTELSKLVLDYNSLKQLDIEKLITIVPKLSTLSIGGNPIKCKEIVRSIRNVNKTSIRQVEVTSIHKIYHEDNVHGIRCGDLDNSLTTNKPENGGFHGDNSSTVYVITVLLIILVAVIAVGLFWYRKRYLRNMSYGDSRVRMRQSIDLSGSDFQGDLLN